VVGHDTRGSSTIARPHLERRLDDALDRRLTCVVAGAGYGKTTLLSRWAGSTPRAMSAWHGLTDADRSLSVLVRAVTNALRLCIPGLPTDLVAAVSGPRGPDTGTDEPGRAQAYAGRICSAVADSQVRPVVLVLDDLEALDGAAEPAAFVAGVCRQAPPGLHVVLASRRDPPFPLARLRGQGLVADLTAAELAFTPAETAEVVHAALGEGPATLADELHALTGGWPAAVRLAGEALARVAPNGREAALDRLRRPGGVVHDYLAEEVIADEFDDARELLVRLAALDRFPPDLAESLAAATGSGAGGSAALAALVRRGVVVEAPARGRSWLSVNSLVRDVLAVDPAFAAGRAGTLALAADWFGDHDEPAAAVRCTLAVGGAVDARVLVGTWGPELLRAGDAELALEAALAVPDADRTAALDRLEGDARQLLGDWDGAVACYQRAAGDSDDSLGGPDMLGDADGRGNADVNAADLLEPGLAWRWGLIHHLRGDLATALAIYARGDLGSGRAAERLRLADSSDLADTALLLCWTATAHWLQGDAERCRALAADTMDRAARSGDDRALAAAHTVLALVAAQDGDRLANDTHYLRALDHAERAGDLLQIVRIRLNRGSRLNEEGFYDEAIAELDLAIGLADLGGYGTLKGIALNNRAESRFALGQVDLAADDVEASKAAFQRLGSLLVGYPLTIAGWIHAARGQTALAHASFAEAIDVSRRSGDLQGLVPALVGLARLVVADDPAHARVLADEAVSTRIGLDAVEALGAQAWVALANGERDEAARLGRQYAGLARDRRDRAALADAAELRAAAAPHGAANDNAPHDAPDDNAPDDAADDARAALTEAATLWEELRHPLGQGRALLGLARLGGPDAPALARRAERLLRPVGARRLAVEAARLTSATAPPPELAIQCLGGFAVLRGGVPVPVGEWRSRKARDLIKMSIAREGRPVHRGVLLEQMWPDEDPDQTSSRLSVALSTARAVLDPGKTRPPAWFLAADADTVWLDLDHLDVDVVRFTDLAALAQAERKGGPTPAATDALTAAEVAYVGDAFPEDPYEDWTVSLRERARAAYIWVARTLADDSTAAGDSGTAVRCWLRVLEHDPYDEHAHLGLVAAHLLTGQQGEARRAYQAYCVRMAEIGVEAAPFPALAPRT
jgi:ATP/maltotriose-dependent transcriptional regulator MalT/DNA-binding SARP family transcriptional activator